MYRRTHRTHPYRKALLGVAVLALVFFAGSDGISMADGSGLPAEARLAQSTKRPAADGTVEIGSENRRKTASGTEETGGTDDRKTAGGTEETCGKDHRKTAGVVDQGRTRPGRPLTTQQKRIFVLGLGADEKN